MGFDAVTALVTGVTIRRLSNYRGGISLNGEETSPLSSLVCLHVFPHCAAVQVELLNSVAHKRCRPQQEVVTSQQRFDLILMCYNHFGFRTELYCMQSFTFASDDESH